MPKLLDQDDLGGLPSARSGRAIARYDTTAIGEGIANFGQGVAIIGDELAKSWQKDKSYKAGLTAEQFIWQEKLRYDEAVRTVGPGGAEGFTQKYLTDYQARVKEHLGTYSPEDRLVIEPKFFELEQGLFSDGVAFERGEQRRSSLNAMNETLDNAIFPELSAIARLPAGDPNKATRFAAVKQRAREIFGGNRFLTPVERDEIWGGYTDKNGNPRPGIESRMDKMFAGNLSPEERLTLDPDYGEVTVAERIHGVESGGRNLRNPNSTATGPGQWLEGSWLDMVRRYRPDLMEGLSRKEILDLRSDEQLSLYMTEQYAAENTKYLTDRQYAATPGNVYLAHFLGPAGAVAMLGADPAASAVGIVGDEVAGANRPVFYRSDGSPKSVSEVVGWASEKMSGAVPTNWSAHVPGLTFEERQAAAADAARQMRESATAQAQADKANYDANLNSLRVAIDAGQAGRLDVENAFDGGFGWLARDAKDYESLIELLDKRDRDGMNLAKAAANWADPNYQWNGHADDDKKQMDLLYEKGGAQNGAGLLDGDANAIGILRSMAERGGYIPKGAVQVLQGGMYSRDPKQRDTAFTIADGLYRENPSAFDQAFSDDDLKRMQDYQSFAPYLSPEDLDKKLNPNLNPQEAKARKERFDEGLTLAKEIDPSEILAAYDTWAPGDAPLAPLDGVAGAQLEADFQNLVADRYAAGNTIEQAKGLAFQLLKRKWGPTDAGKSRYLMARPPENYHRRIDGSFDWMDEQLNDIVEERYPDAQVWGPIYRDYTEGAAVAGVTPSYAIGIIDKNGIWQVIEPPDDATEGWPFDYGRASAERQQRFLDEFGGPFPPASSAEELEGVGKRTKHPLSDFTKTPEGSSAYEPPAEPEDGAASATELVGRGKKARRQLIVPPAKWPMPGEDGK